MNKLSFYLSKMNVTGSEKDLSLYLKENFEKESINAEIDLLNNVIVKNPESEKIKTVICCPIDNPGFITLYLESETSFLTRTENYKNEKESVSLLLDDKGNEFLCKKSKKYPDFLKITDEKGKLGKIFRYETNIRETKEKISGKFVSRYLLIDVLSSLSDLVKEKDIALCFTAGFHSLSKSENIIAKKFRPESIILLGFAEEKEKSPLLYVKDGKAFSDKSLTESAKTISEKHKIPLCLKASDKSITKAETIAISGGTATLSLALPCEKQGESDECVLLESAQNLKKLLRELILTK